MKKKAPSYKEAQKTSPALGRAPEKPLDHVSDSSGFNAKYLPPFLTASEPLQCRGLSKARTKTLPRLVLTEVVSKNTSGASEVSVKAGASSLSYFTRSLANQEADTRPDKQKNPTGSRFNLFPLVIDSTGKPWAEASLYILARLTESINPSMGTYRGIADDLSAFLRFIEDSEIDWMSFPKNKLTRPTYRYRAQLSNEVSAGHLAASTAKRRIGAIVAFYSWLRQEKLAIFENDPWIESDRYIQFTNMHGSRGSKKVKTTDLSIKIGKQEDPYSEFIEDGGKLRPLPETEQSWLLDALVKQGNTELTLIHLFSLLTGARIQTVLTIRVKHVTTPHLVSIAENEVRIPVGPGTDIDTKNNKRMILHLPVWFYEMLSVYACSRRATTRRKRTTDGDSADQHLFLTLRGNPFYENKEQAGIYRDTNTRRHSKDGQAVRQLIGEYVIPKIRQIHEANFSYRLHDLRATYGMNLTNEQLERVARGEITLHEAREYVKTRMGHASAAITDRYLQYKRRLNFVRQVNSKHGEHLKSLAERAMLEVR